MNNRVSVNYNHIGMFAIYAYFFRTFTHFLSIEKTNNSLNRFFV